MLNLHAPDPVASPIFPRLYCPPAPHFPAPCPVPPEPEDEPSALLERTPAQRAARLRGFCDGFRGEDRQDFERHDVLSDYLLAFGEGADHRTGASHARTSPEPVASDF